MISKLKIEGNGRIRSTKVYVINPDGTRTDITNGISKIEISGTPGPPGDGIPTFKAILHFSFTEVDIEAITEQRLPIV